MERLESGQLDDVEALLKWREAAFHEFSAADSLAVDDSSQEELRQAAFGLWREIAEVNAKLESALNSVLDKLGRLLAKRIENRKKLAKFHSGMDRDLGL